MPKTAVSSRYFALAQELKGQIRHNAPGTQLPTVKELTEKWGASKATVDRALGRLRREGLVYRPAGRQRLVVSEIRDRTLRTITMIRPDFPAPLFEAITRAVVEAGRQRNWAFDHVNYHVLEGLDLAKALGENDGAILLASPEKFPQHLVDAFRWQRAPIVVLQEPAEGLPVGNICMDNLKIGELAVEHLADLGHRNILSVISEPRNPVGLKRIEGWRRAMKKLGRANPDDLLVDCQLQPFKDSKLGTYRYFREWLQREPPEFTAVFVTSNGGAMALLRVFREQGIRVPEDISVMTFDDGLNIAAFTHPPMTVLDIDMSEYANQAVAILNEQLTRPDATPRQIKIEPFLVKRRSTARPKDETADKRG